MAMEDRALLRVREALRRARAYRTRRPGAEDRVDRGCDSGRPGGARTPRRELRRWARGCVLLGKKRKRSDEG